MKKNISLLITLFFMIFLFMSCNSSNVIINDEVINKIELKNVQTYKNGYKKLLNDANKASKKKYKTVIDKKIVPPSGDKHDYISRAIYYWPDNKNIHKKWKYIDGKINKKSLKETDHYTFFEAMGAIRDLSLAYKLSNKEKYTKKASQIIKQWFINKSTKMNPNFNYA